MLSGAVPDSSGTSFSSIAHRELGEHVGQRRGIDASFNDGPALPPAGNSCGLSNRSCPGGLLCCKRPCQPPMLLRFDRLP